MSHFVIHNQSWYVSQDLHPEQDSSIANIWKYYVTWGPNQYKDVILPV